MPGKITKLPIFISWSGERAGTIGQAFHDLLPETVNLVQPFFSTEDVDRGTRWADVINANLLEAPCAIVCLTPTSVQAPWVAFETGAISRAAGGSDGAKSRIWTYLLGIEMASLHLTPFAAYQHTRASRDETFRLIESINGLSPDSVSPEVLKHRFDALFWPQFEPIIKKTHTITDVISSAVSANEVELLTEILHTVRSIQEDVRRSDSIGVPVTGSEIRGERQSESFIAELARGLAGMMNHEFTDRKCTDLKAYPRPDGCIVLQRGDRSIVLSAAKVSLLHTLPGKHVRGLVHRLCLGEFDLLESGFLEGGEPAQ